MGTFDDDDDLEYLAIGKCSKALSILDNESRIRVMRYLLDKFGFIENNSFTPTQTPQNNFKKENLPIEAKIHEEVIPSQNGSESVDRPTIKDIIIKNYTKTEPDLALVIAYYASNFGTDSFERNKFSEAYKANGILTVQRTRNLSSIIRGLIRKSYLKTITDNTYSVLPEGVRQAEAIIAGNSTSVSKKKATSKKNKLSLWKISF